jgi:quinol-cytochrome oxidoreductase complex cytochrome b subunit
MHRVKLVKNFKNFCKFLNNIVAHAVNCRNLVMNHVHNYGVPQAITYLWAVGFSLVMILVNRFISGYCLVSNSVITTGVISLLMDIINASYGFMVIGLHRIGSSLIQALAIVHQVRAMNHSLSSISCS